MALQPVSDINPTLIGRVIRVTRASDPKDIYPDQSTSIACGRLENIFWLDDKSEWPWGLVLGQEKVQLCAASQFETFTTTKQGLTTEH